MWSLVRAYSLIILQKLIFLYRFGDINMRSIILSCCPLFYISSLFSIVSIRPLELVLASKYSAYSSLAIYLPPYLKQWALKSPRSIISPLASLIAVLTLGYVLIQGPSPYKLQTLIIIVFSSFRYSQRAIIKGLYYLRFQYIVLIFQLIIKQIFVIGRALYISVKPLRQYINLVYLLYTNS